jgi:hypothetical protein
VEVASGEDDEVAGVQGRVRFVSVDLEPACSPGDDVEGGEAVRADAKAPGRAQGRAAVDRARDAEIAQQRLDFVGLCRAREQSCQCGSPFRLPASR